MEIVFSYYSISARI